MPRLSAVGISGLRAGEDVNDLNTQQRNQFATLITHCRNLTMSIDRRLMLPSDRVKWIVTGVDGSNQVVVRVMADTFGVCIEDARQAYDRAERAGMVKA